MTERYFSSEEERTMTWHAASVRATALFNEIGWDSTLRKIEAVYRLNDGEMIDCLSYLLATRTDFPVSRSELNARWLDLWAAYRDHLRFLARLWADFPRQN